ncbi:MAG: rod shape-determining protein MreD [Actinomycetota bacterium]
MRRTVSITLIILTALLLQSTIFGEIRLVGARPELIYLVTILLAMMEGPSEGAIVGFAGGMAQDFLLNQPKGMTALTLTLLGYVIGTLRQYIVTPSPWLPVILAGIGTFAGVVFYGSIAFLLGQLDTGWGYLLKVALLSGAYNALLTPVVYPLLKRVSQASSARRVFRW